MATIAGITLRQLLSRRRTLLLLLLASVPVVLALVYRLGGEAASPEEAISWTLGMLEYLGLVTVVPLVALIFGSGAMGGEVEDGTAVHLLTKPVPRWRVGVAKLAVAAVCAVVLGVTPVLLAGLIGSDEVGVAVGYAIGAAVGAVVYAAVFLALSLITSRAFIIGLGYVLIWEGLLAGLFPGIATFSVRQYAISVAQSVTDALSPIVSGLEPRLALGTAIVAALVVLGLAVGIAVRRLSRLEITGETA